MQYGSVTTARRCLPASLRQPPGNKSRGLRYPSPGVLPPVPGSIRSPLTGVFALGCVRLLYSPLCSRSLPVSNLLNVFSSCSSHPSLPPPRRHTARPLTHVSRTLPCAASQASRPTCVQGGGNRRPQPSLPCLTSHVCPCTLECSRDRRRDRPLSSGTLCAQALRQGTGWNGGNNGP